MTELKRELGERILESYGFEVKIPGALTGLITGPLPVPTEPAGSPNRGYWIRALVESLFRSKTPTEVYPLLWPLYRNPAIVVSASQDPGIPGTWSVRVGILGKTLILRGADPEWIWKNHGVVTEFMSDDYQPYQDLLGLAWRLNKELSNIEL